MSRPSQRKSPQVPGQQDAVDQAPDAPVEPVTPVAKQYEGADLPDAADVDATKIKRAVLTMQGWVVPVTTEPLPTNRY